jgi:hypothetical protein
MKQIITKIGALLLAIVVLSSTLSFTINMHFCGDYLVDAAVFSEAESCGTQTGNSASDSCSDEKNDCCSDELFMIDGQDELIVDSFKYSVVNQQLFVSAFFISYINLFEGLEKEFVPFKTYLPPSLVEDILVSHQVFRI